MKRIVILCALALAGCGDLNPPVYRCIGGAVHQWINGAWWKLDGGAYLSRPPGPIPCSEGPAPGDRREVKP